MLIEDSYLDYCNSEGTPDLEDYDPETHKQAVVKLAAASLKFVQAADALAEYETDDGKRREERWVDGKTTDAFNKAGLDYSVAHLILSRAYHSSAQYLESVFYEPYMVVELARQQKEFDEKLEREKQRS